jgi:hypothetical protein
MALQTSGVISLSNIATEFKVAAPLNNVALSSFRKVAEGVSKGPVAGVIKPIAANVNVPTGGQVKLSNFYGAAYYYIQVKFELTGETTSTYADSNNGTIRVYVYGATNNYRVVANGITTDINTNGGDAFYAGLNSGSYTITVSDNSLNTTGYTFTANIGYGAEVSSVTGYALGQVHDIA